MSCDSFRLRNALLELPICLKKCNFGMKMKVCFFGVDAFRASEATMVMPMRTATLFLTAIAVVLFLPIVGFFYASAHAATNSLTITWTAPGNDSMTGTASLYDIRYSTIPLSVSNWASATQVNGEPLPRLAGSTESFTIQGLSPGVTYFVAIKTSDAAGNWSGISNITSATTSIVLGTDDEGTNTPSDFQLHQNYPNPFNPNTTIEFSIPRDEHVQIVIFNIIGERVITLMSDYLAAGHHQVSWNGIDLYGRSVASGIYLYSLEAGSGVWTRKMTLLK